MLRKIITAVIFSGAILTGMTQPVFAMRQPAMEKALQALEDAESVLRRALPNKGGHRVKALRHIRKAIEEIKLEIEFANNRPAGGQYKEKKLLKD